MVSFEYKPIGLEGPAFRLLRLLKGDKDPIQGQLFESTLPPPEHVGDYAALSYTWGGKSTPCEIMIDGRKMIITKNAYLALRDLRYQEKDRILWIDALCINQNDDKERGEQVQQMGPIYRMAERVIMWLGEATYDTDCVMHYMKELEKEGTKYASNDQNISNKEWVIIWSAVVHSLSADQRDLLVEGLWSLLHRNWFKRVWIIQEVASAKVAEIVCGSKSVSASIFALMPSLLEITPDPHCQPILDIIPGPLRSSSWWAEKRDLHTVLARFCKSEATDPRDRIYALLGISSDACNTDLLKANYEKNIEDVMWDTASFLLNFHELNSPVSRFFDWPLLEFLGNLNLLANEALKYALDTEHGPLIELLIVRDDVNVNIRVGDWTPLQWAVFRGNEVVVKLLLDKKSAELEANVNWIQKSLSWAAECGHERVVELLLERGAVLEAKDECDRTPLILAAQGGHERVVELLLERGAVLEAKDKYDSTPLILAAQGGRERVVQLLLAWGAVLEAKNILGNTALVVAANCGQERMVKLLVEKGARKPMRVVIEKVLDDVSYKLRYLL